MPRFRTFGMLVASLALTLVAPAAFADPLIDFGTGFAGKGGTIAFAGGAAPLVGSNIRIGLVTGVGTFENDDSHAVTGNSLPYGILNFTTGSFQGYSGGAYQFGNGGTFQIFGNVPDAGISGAGSGALLFAGVFGSASVSRIGAFDTLFASGTDVYENPALVTYFGLPTTTLFDFSAYITATGSLGSGTPFSITAFSTDWANPDPPPPPDTVTPEPASLVLLGTGFTLLAMRLRRRQTTKQA